MAGEKTKAHCLVVSWQFLLILWKNFILQVYTVNFYFDIIARVALIHVVLAGIYIFYVGQSLDRAPRAGCLYIKYTHVYAIVT